MPEMQITEVALKELRVYGNNPRKNDKVVPKMCDAIKEFGFRVPVLALRNGEIIDGHLRVKAAAKLKMESVPVVYVDGMSDAQVRAFRILVNASVDWAAWDEEKLAAEIDYLQHVDFDVRMTGLSDSELSGILDSLIEPDDVDDEPDMDVDPDVKEPDLFRCPACGNLNTKKAFKAVK